MTCRRSETDPVGIAAVSAPNYATATERPIGNRNTTGTDASSLSGISARSAPVRMETAVVVPWASTETGQPAHRPGKTLRVAVGQRKYDRKDAAAGLVVREIDVAAVLFE